MWALSQYARLTCLLVLCPDHIAVAGLTQAIKSHVRHKLIPVDDQDDEAPELLLSRSSHLIYWIQKKSTGATLSEFKRSCDGIFLTILRQLRFFTPFRIREQIESDGFCVFLHRINLRDDPLRCQLEGLHHTIFVR